MSESVENTQQAKTQNVINKIYGVSQFIMEFCYKRKIMATNNIGQYGSPNVSVLVTERQYTTQETDV